MPELQSETTQPAGELTVPSGAPNVGSAITRIDAILPAGGRIDSDLAQKVGTDVKALISFEGKTMIQIMVEALRESGKIGRIVVIGNDAIKARVGDLVDAVLPEGSTGPENIFKGLDYLEQDHPELGKVLVCTTDLPFVTSSTIENLVNLCSPTHDVTVPLIDRASFDRAYPDTNSTFVRLKSEEYTLGGIFMLDAAAMRTARSHIDAVFENRKSKLGMAKLLGPGFLIKFLMKTLTLQDVENKIKSMLECTGTAIPGAPVELAYDIDDVVDYDYAAAYFEKAS